MRRRDLLEGLSVSVGLSLAGCTDDSGGPPVTTVDDDTDLAVSSPAFVDGATIPTRYTFEGDDISPPLSIGGVPDGVASLVLVVDDPDAPNPPFTHWLVWQLPADTREIPTGISQSRRVESLGGAHQGTNDFGELGYRGPRPPEDDGAHTYRFTVYAVEESLDVQAGARRGRVDEGLRDNVVANARFTGEFER